MSLQYTQSQCKEAARYGIFFFIWKHYLYNPILRKCMKIIIDQITKEITTDQNDFQNTLNIQFGHLVSILSAISLIALVGSILILKWFPQLNCDRNWPSFKI